MAKKRKAVGPRSNEPKAFDPKDGKLGPIRTYEDVANPEDEFHIQRDKVLLADGPEAKRRKKWENESPLLELSDEEILANSASDSEEHEEEDVGEGADTLSKPHELRKVAALDSESEEDEEQDDDAGGWGTSKKDYYHADQIETEADALEEEAEVKRLQQKKLQKMSEADFGFDETEWLDGGVDGGVDNTDGNVVTEVLKDLEITKDMNSKERLKLLQVRYPEFDALANEYLELQPLLKELQSEVNGVVAPNEQARAAPRVEIIKWRALTAYVGALTMYFAVLTSAARSSSGNSNALDPTELREHGVMESLLQSRELWFRVKNRRFLVKTLLEGDSANVEMSIPQSIDRTPPPVTQEIGPKKGKKERRREKSAIEAAKTRTERLRAAEEEVQDLSSLLPNFKKPFKAVSSKPIAQDADSDSDFGEEESLSARAAAEKAAKKKSLRFYTSQIVQKANKRAGAGRDAGGDADLPHRERLRDRQARLNAEAEKRGKKLDEYGRGTALGGNSDNEENDKATANKLYDEEDEYYDLVAQSSRMKKEEKTNRFATIAAAKAAGKTVRVVEGEVGDDGKRAIGYVIEKNKGLAPKRKKDVRNPRVKKRKKFEEKKKKLSSVRAVYKGGEGRGGYGGEKTGIKIGLVKSIKL